MKQRKCSVCGIVQDITLFGKDKSEIGGRKYACKTCMSKRSFDYQHTKKGMVAVMYSSQRSSSKRRGHDMPTYSLNDLRAWLFSQPDFHVMFDNWKRLDYQRWYKPSIDRIDDAIGYTMANIQLITWQENSDKRKQQMKNGDVVENHRGVVQMTLEGDILDTFMSLGDASRSTGIQKQNISAVCRGTREKAGGFMWIYSTK